ncbi:MAG: glycosyltransferase family 2 protein, partial [Desulfocapsa sp.]
TRILSGRAFDFYVYKGKKTEEIPADERNKMPWRYLFTGNVLVPREVLKTIDFDEQFIGYGYEDIEWGIRLFSRYPIHHIDNTCSHLGLVGKDVAFSRMRNSIPNFQRIEALHPGLFYQTGAARMARIFSVLPKPLLKELDTILSRLFAVLSINILCFYLFQFDKAVLLALASENERDT